MTHLLAVMGRGVVPAADPIITAGDVGISRGDGCFDAMRVVGADVGAAGAAAGTDVGADMGPDVEAGMGADTTTRVDHMAGHLARFERSAAALGLRIDRAAWDDLIATALAAWTHPGEATLKVVVTRGPEATPGVQTEFCTLTPADPGLLADRAGMSVLTFNRGYASDLFVDVPWLLGGVKLLSYAINMAAQREARARGAREALFTSTDGFALEGPTSAIVWHADNGLWTTPTGSTGILDSVTVAALFAAAEADGMRTGSGLIRPADITQAWMLSAVRGACPITTLDGRPLITDSELTARVAAWAGF